MFLHVHKNGRSERICEEAFLHISVSPTHTKQ
jgi:hypothetical protein